MSDLEHTPSGHRWFAATYDLITKPGEKRLGKLRRELLADLRGDVLEIGAGTGANFEHYPQGVRVVALEPDPHMLKRAQKRLLELGRADIDVRLAPAEQLPVDDASFDAVVATLVLCTVHDQPRALAEIAPRAAARAASCGSSSTCVAKRCSAACRTSSNRRGAGSPRAAT